jgi:hypothetical protein
LVVFAVVRCGSDPPDKFAQVWFTTAGEGGQGESEGDEEGMERKGIGSEKRRRRRRRERRERTMMMMKRRRR